MAAENTTKARLNMEHGFMQSIIKNQVDRDEYDKEQKLFKAQSKILKEGQRRKRAAMQVYVPPHLRNKATSEETKPDQKSATLTSPTEEAVSKVLQLKLEFERQDGEVCELNIYEGEDLRKSVTAFGRANGLDSRLRDALYHRLSRAMKDRAA